MWSAAPRSTGDSRVDAAFAAMAEYLARRDGWMVPSWARLPEREAWPWWFVTDLRGLHPRARVESPSSFRRRGVFIISGALDRDVRRRLALHGEKRKIDGLSLVVLSR